MGLTQSQFADFMRQVYVAFPNVYQALKFGVDQQATEAVWFAALSQFTAQELRGVLMEWIHAKEVPFKANEIGFLQNIIRSRIFFQRDQVARLKAAQQEASSVERRRKDYRPIGGLHDLYMIGLRANDLLNAGQMSESQWLRVRDNLVEQAGRSDLTKIVDPIDDILRARVA